MYRSIVSAALVSLGLKFVSIGGQEITDKPPASAPAPSPISSSTSYSSGSGSASRLIPTPEFPDCNVTNIGWLGDGWCDDATIDGFGGEYNTEACGWDGGDCCECDCTDGFWTCGVQAPYACKDPYSTCGPCANRNGVNTVGDGICDPGNYHNEECALDGGDCDGQTCSNGVVGFEGSNDNGIACCPIGCTKCGGSGCGNVGAAFGFDNTDCCVNGVINEVFPCADAGVAPCVIEDDRCNPNPCGENAVCDSSGNLFCTCEEGFENAADGGYDYSGYVGYIDCVPIVEEPECSDGLAGIKGDNANGSACCPVECGQCGGSGCARAGRSAGLDNTDCCINGVLNNQDLCSTTGAAPCVL